MHFKAMFKMLGILLMLFSVSMLLPIGVGLLYHHTNVINFLESFVLTFGIGLMLWLSFRNYIYELRTRDGFLMVVLIWVVLTAFGSIPFLFTLYPTLSFTDAIFETTSGLTTTGASVIPSVRNLSHAMLYYRQQLHLFGGIGIIVLAVAVTPMLGIGGMQLYRAEVTGPMKTTKLTPRIKETAQALWYVYFGLAALCTLSYWLAGMSLFDAVGESFSTISTGGFSTHDNSFAYYHSITIELIATIFMLLSATNFALHFHALKQRQLSVYVKDREFLAYLKIILVTTAIVVIILLVHEHPNNHHSFINILFTVTSLISTTGLTTTDFSIWPSFLPFLMMFIALLGGCAGSTAGGIKIIRGLLLHQQGKRELKRLIHPSATWAVKIGNQILPEHLMQAVWAFMSFFIATFVIFLLGLLATGLNFTTAFSVIVTCISNTGAGIGGVAGNFSHLPTLSKWICIVAMLIGRLEIFTILVLFLPTYWRN